VLAQHLFDRALLADEEGAPLPAAQEPAEFGVLVARSARVTTRIQPCLAAYSARIAGDSSVEPSSTITQRAGRTLCAMTLSSVWRMYLASLRPGEMRR
jgi:hypothetical protein